MEINHEFKAVPRVLMARGIWHNYIALCSHEVNNPDKIHFDRLILDFKSVPEKEKVRHDTFIITDSTTGTGAFRCLGVDYFYNDQ
jgi:hypothetical protein